jgi:hypothetical protein
MASCRSPRAHQRAAGQHPHGCPGGEQRHPDQDRRRDDRAAGRGDEERQEGEDRAAGEGQEAGGGGRPRRPDHVLPRLGLRRRRIVFVEQRRRLLLGLLRRRPPGPEHQRRWRRTPPPGTIPTRGPAAAGPVRPPPGRGPVRRRPWPRSRRRRRRRGRRPRPAGPGRAPPATRPGGPASRASGCAALVRWRAAGSGGACPPSGRRAAPRPGPGPGGPRGPRRGAWPPGPGRPRRRAALVPGAAGTGCQRSSPRSPPPGRTDGHQQSRVTPSARMLARAEVAERGEAFAAVGACAPVRSGVRSRRN